MSLYLLSSRRGAIRRTSSTPQPSTIRNHWCRSAGGRRTTTSYSEWHVAHKTHLHHPSAHPHPERDAALMQMIIYNLIKSYYSSMVISSSLSSSALFFRFYCCFHAIIFMNNFFVCFILTYKTYMFVITWWWCITRYVVLKVEAGR